MKRYNATQTPSDGWFLKQNRATGGRLFVVVGVEIFVLPVVVVVVVDASAYMNGTCKKYSYYCAHAVKQRKRLNCA